MKSIKKFLFVMAALAAVWSFVSCSSDDDDPKTIAVYENIWDSDESITFYDDGTFETIDKILGTMATGTYKGDVTKNTGADNKVTYTVKKMLDYDLKLHSIEEYVEMNGEDIKDWTDIEATIKDGTLKCHSGEYKLKK